MIMRDFNSQFEFVLEIILGCTAAAFMILFVATAIIFLG